MTFESWPNYNYADEQDITEELKESLECDTEHLTEQFDINGMKAILAKYQGIVFGTMPD